MSGLVRRRILVLLACCALLFPTRPAKGLSIGGAVAIVSVVAGAVIVTTVALTIHFLHHPTIKGCVSNGAGGLQLQDEYAQQVFLLSGNTAGIIAGDVVKLKGRKKRHKPDSLFLVEDVKKDYGACPVTSATP